MGALPLRNLSRLWGYMNSLELPIWIRPTGFKVYAYIFGCHLDEVEKDLKEYTSLGDFFYRQLRPGVRPIADAPLVSEQLRSERSRVHKPRTSIGITCGWHSPSLWYYN